MKIRIAQNGSLHILRETTWIPQICPFSEKDIFCGEWCPHFNEPIVGTRSVELELCFKKVLRLSVDNFFDERE